MVHIYKFFRTSMQQRSHVTLKSKILTQFSNNTQNEQILVIYMKTFLILRRQPVLQSKWNFQQSQN